jgi:tRNA threonylcarbamoyl adenosine modification protein YeaZ
MNILAVETSLGVHSVAVQAGAVLTVRSQDREASRAETVVLLIQQTMREAGLAYADLDLIAAATGPGSFTAIRTGLAAARGIALAAGKPVVGATSLEVIAAEVAANARVTGRFAVALDARKDEIYIEVFDAGGVSVGEPSLMARSEAGALRAEGVVAVAGPGADILAGWLDDAIPAVGLAIVPTAARLALMAPTLARDRRASPAYIRPADAKPPSPDTAVPRVSP